MGVLRPFFPFLLVALVASGATAEVVPDSVPAWGTHDALLTIHQWGRYSVQLDSPYEAELTLVDRMTGPGTQAPLPGGEKNRIDTFLDQGEYLAITRGPEKGAGHARLSLLPFQELHSQPPTLEPLEVVADELGDLSQRSYRIRVAEPRWVFVEAAGRSLADLRWWRDWQWLVDAETELAVVEPVPGQSLRRVRQHVFLQPGEYLLTAYGGPRLPWASGQDTEPFYLRMDMPRLAVAGRSRHQVGPTGTDHWLVPGEADFFRLELERAGRAELSVVSWEPGGRSRSPVSRGALTRETQPPVTELRLGGSRDGWSLVSVRADAGTAYVFQHFEIRWSWEIFEEGSYWLAALFAGDPRDRPEATGILTELPRPGDRRRRLLTSQTLGLGGSGESRRFNLSGPLTLHLHAPVSARYRVEVKGITARLRLEPFVASWAPRDSDLEPEPWRSGSGSWDLERGFYVLELEPQDAVGVAELSVGPEGLPNAAVTQPRGMVQLGVVDLQSRHGHEIFLGQSETSEVGFVLRAVPLDLEEPLPLEVTPGQPQVLPVVVHSWGLLRASAEDGASLEVSVDGSPWREKWAVSPGNHRVEVRSDQERSRVCSVAVTPLSQIPGNLRPETDGTGESRPPDRGLPTLAAGDPSFFDLGEDEEQLFLVEAEEAGFYRVESSGLLDLEGRLRTRTVPVLARASEGGSGRNFLIQEYLRAGEYLLSARTRGSSRGRASVRLSRTSLRDSEAIAPELPARSHLAAGEGAVYRFGVPDTGRYRISSFAAGGGLARIRLEDSSGWPVVRPGRRAEIVRELESGDYRLIVLPEAVDGFRLTMLSRLNEPPGFEGHGPHPLPLGVRVEHVWREPETGEERLPDVWELDLPAASPVRIELGSEMHGDLYCGEVSEYVPPMKGWQGRLPRGQCRLEVLCVRRNNRLAYGVEITPEHLLEGHSRSLEAPGELPLAVGQDGLMEISSYGASDVRADLLDVDGRLLARSDDRPDDWNLQLRERLEPGQYLLKVTPVGVSSASTEVSLTRVPERVEHSIKPPLSAMDVDLAGTLLFPLELPGTSQFLELSAISAENLELSVEVEEEGEWRRVAREVGHRPRLLLPVDGGSGKEARVRLGSLDGRGLPASLEVAYQSPTRLREVGLKGDLPSGAIQLALARAGSFQVSGGGQDLCVATGLFSPCVPAPGGIVSGEKELWLSGSAGASIHRLRLAHETMRMPLSPMASSRVDLQPEEGLVLVRAVSRSDWVGLALADAPLDTFAVARNTSLALVEARSDTPIQLEIWPSPSSRGQQIVLLDRRLIATPESRLVDWGEHEGPLVPGSARVLELPVGMKRIRVALGRGLVAAVRETDGNLNVIWRGGAPFEELLEGETREVFLLNPGDHESSYRVGVVALAEGGRNLHVTPSRAAEIHLDRTSWIRVPVQGNSVHWAGEVRDAVWRGEDGTVVLGARPGLGVGQGSLHLSCDPGWVLVWQELTAHAGPPWGTLTVPDARDVSTPAVLRLSGAAQAFRVDPGAPGLLLARSAEALALEVPGVGVRLFGGATSWDVPTDGEPLEIRVRSTGSGPLSGELELQHIAALPLSEGLGPETLLAPGESRVFRFEVHRPGLVGVGVRADSVAVTTALRNARGELVGTGFLQMHELSKGEYFLALWIPPDSDPVRAWAAVAGLDPPSMGPPDEIVAMYLELERQTGGSASGGEE